MTDVLQEMQGIYNLVSQGKPDEALQKVEDYESHNPNDATFRFNKPGFLIDIGFRLKNKDIVQQGLALGRQVLEDQLTTTDKIIIRYNLANGYIDLYELCERKSGIEAILQSENLQKAKAYFRESLSKADDQTLTLKKQILVNYGNCLDILGRGVESLYAYDAALKIDKNFSMALGNKAITLLSFADISGQYRGAIYLEAYQTIKRIINKQDLIEIGGLSAKQSFEQRLKKIEALFNDEKVLSLKLKHKKYDSEKLSDFEKFYIDFSMKEKLFLNFHIHEDSSEEAITDPIFIQMITGLDDNDTFYAFAKYINQIKEDYAVARLLLVQSQYKRQDFDNISRRTLFVNTLDYSQFDLYTGLLKSSFKQTFDILDKIAMFLNDYLKLSLKERDVYFMNVNVWQIKNQIRDEILKTRNISLYALYDIFQDFNSKYLVMIKEIRNALTHRRLVVYDPALAGRNIRDDKHHIGYDMLLKQTIQLLQLAKSGIVYLVNFVNIEEGKKRKGGKVLPMYVDTWQFLSVDNLRKR